MEEHKSLKKNVLFNGMLSFAGIAFPLVTTPYISRVLDISDIGVINHGSAFASLFISVASLGLSGYASREIARVRSDRGKVSHVFWSVLAIHFLSSVLIVLFYVGYVQLCVGDERLRHVLLIYAAMVAAKPFEVEWLYTGLEEFKYISLRSITIKTVMFLLLFVLVRDESDFLWYAVLLVCAQSANGFYNLIHSRKYVNRPCLRLGIKNVLSCSKYFYFQVLVAVCYQYANQIFLGNTNESELALFVRAASLTAIIQSVVNTVLNALKPRVEHVFVKNLEGCREYIDKGFSLVMFILFPMCFGLAALSEEAMRLFGGAQFVGGGTVLRIAALSAFITNLSVFFNNIVSTPAGFEKNTMFGNIAVAVVSLALNPFLARRYGGTGAATALLAAEAAGLLVHAALAFKEHLYLKFVSPRLCRYAVSALAMYAFICLVRTRISSPVVSVLVCVPSAAVLYAGLCFLLMKISDDKGDHVFAFVESCLMRIRR